MRQTFTSNSTQQNPASQLVTFETLPYDWNSQVEEPLINKEPWKNIEFQKLYFEKKKKFEIDQENLKDEFYKWHKEMGIKLFDMNLKKFNFVPFKLTSIDLTKFMQFHPLLTQKDLKKLELIRQELKNKYRRQVFTNFFVGMTLMLTYLRLKSKRENKSIGVIVKKLYAPLVFAFFMSVIWVDARFRIYKPLYMGEMITNKGMDKKYFLDYLT